jgi:serine/threonine protein kinase/HSP20 family molecular chaperone IbpA
MTSKITFPTSSEQYEKLYKIGFNAWKARLKNDPEVEVATKLHNVDASYDKEMIKEEIGAIEEMCRGQEGFLVECQRFFVDNVLWIVCDFAAWSEGTVKDIVSLHNEEGGVLDEQLVRAIGNQLLAPLEFLHSKGRIFRDLRCKNLMVTPEGEIQLQLFTLPSILQEKAPIYKDSLFWASPELLLQERVPGSSMTPAAMAAAASSVGTPVDVWALGITLLELALGDVPFHPDMTPSQLFQAIVEGDSPTLPPEIAPLWSKGFKEVIQKCLIKDPALRPSIAELKTHPFFTGAPGPEYIKEHLLAPLPPIEARWKLISQIREQQEIAKHERREHAEKLAQQAAQFAQSATELPDFGALGPSLPGTSLSGPALGMGNPMATNSNISSGNSSVGSGPTIGQSAGGPSIPSSSSGPSLLSGLSIHAHSVSGGPSLTNPPVIASSGPVLGGPSLGVSAHLGTNVQQSAEGTPIGSNSSSAASTASSSFPLGSVPAVNGHVPIAVAPSGFTPRPLMHVASTSSLPITSTNLASHPVGAPDNPFLYDAGGAPLQGNPIKQGGERANSAPTHSQPMHMAQGGMHQQIQANLSQPVQQEPQRGRFRIVNPGSNAATPSGSLDLSSPHQVPTVSGSYASPTPPYLTQAEGGYAATTGQPLQAPQAHLMGATGHVNQVHPSITGAQGNIAQLSSSRRSSKSQLAPATATQTPAFNVPVEAYLGENERDYIVIFRAIPGTMVSIALEGKTLVISGQIPPLSPSLLKQIHTTERPISKFERKITFPGEVDPNDFGRELIREQNTMIIRVKKSPKSIHMGDDMF